MSILITRKPYLIFLILIFGLLLVACSPSAEKLNQEGNQAFTEQAFIEALEAYQNAQIESPELAEPYYNAANAYYRQGQYEQALEQLQHALQFAKDDNLAENSIYNLGNNFFNSQELETAIEAYKSALLLDPHDQDAKYNLELARVQTTHGITMAKAALCNTMGIPIESEIDLVYDAVQPKDIGLPEMAVLIDKARESQSEIKALEHRREMLGNVVKINKAAYMPNIVAQGNYNFKRPNRSYEPEFYNSWDVTLALQMNLFDWGEGWHKTTKAKSQLRQLEIGIEQAKNGIALGVEKNYLDVREAFEKIGITEKALEQAEKSYAIIADQMAYGVAKNSDLLDAQRTLTEATINYHNGVINYYLKRSELEHLLDENS